MKQKIIYALLATSLLALASCSGDKVEQKNTTSVDQVQNVKIGVLVPLSGDAAAYGEDAVNVYKMIVNKFNSENKNIHAELVIEDDRCSGKDSASAMQKLINVDNVQVVVGGICSAATFTAGNIAQAQGIAMISPTSSAANIANIGDYVFRYWNDDDVTKKLDNYLSTQGVKKLAVLAEDTDYGVGYMKGVRENFQGEVTLEEKFQSNEKDFSILAKKIKNNASNFDAITLIANNDSSEIALIKALDKEGVLTMFKGKIYGSEVLGSDTTIKTLGKTLDGMKIAKLEGLEQLGEGANKFMTDYRLKYQISGVDFFIILEAEAMAISLDAIKNNGYKASAIRDYFKSFTADNQRDGIFGKYYFTPTRDAAGLDFKIFEIQDSKMNVVE